MTTTTKPKPDDPIGTVRRMVLDEAGAINKADRTPIRIKAIVKCTQNGTSAPQQSIKTALKFNASIFEEGVGITFKVKLESAVVATWFTTNRHYVLQLRDPEVVGDGAPINNKQPGEILSVLLFVKYLGRAPRKKPDQPHFSVVDLHEEGFAFEAVMDDDCALSENLPLTYVGRLVLLPAPEWIETWDEERQKRQLDRETKPGHKGPIDGQLGLPFDQDELDEDDEDA